MYSAYLCIMAIIQEGCSTNTGAKPMLGAGHPHDLQKQNQWKTTVPVMSCTCNDRTTCKGRTSFVNDGVYIYTCSDRIPAFSRQAFHGY